jgi:hypothetical protein
VMARHRIIQQPIAAPSPPIDELDRADGRRQKPAPVESSQ